MANIVTRLLLASTVTAPTFFSLGLIGVIKNGKDYFGILINGTCPNTIEWWMITFSFVFMLISLFGINLYLRSLSKTKNYYTIKPCSYSFMEKNCMEQIFSSIIPWISLFVENVEFNYLFICIALQCMLITIASYNNSNYNLIFSVLGYRYYEVKTTENTYYLLSKYCIKNKNEINKFVSLTDYMGIIIK